MWQYFQYIVYSSLVLFIISSVCIYWKKLSHGTTIALVLHSIATLILAWFVVNLWIELERPPMRTLAETRIWYSLFIGFIGIIIYTLYKQKWMLNYAALMSSVFLIITLYNPDSMNKTLMPALQSVWFIPHVIVYIFAYAMLGMSAAVSIYGLYRLFKAQGADHVIKIADQLINIGYAFLTLGLLFGALWAKEAWGHYWTWDPKETWAFITWLGYLIYIHYRYKHKAKSLSTSFYILIIAFVFLLICWFGVNYLPTAQNSVHTYTS